MKSTIARIILISCLSWPISLIATFAFGQISISDGQQINGTLETGDEQLSDGSFVDIYFFEGFADQTAIVSMWSDDMDTYLFLFFVVPDGEVEIVGEDDDGGGGTNSQISVRLLETGTYSIVATSLSAGDTGEYTVSLRLEDGSTGPIMIADIADQTITEGEEFISINLDDHVSDPDNEDAEMVWACSGDIELIVDISDARVATVAAPTPDWVGSETITFAATDPDGLSDSDSATFTVSPKETPTDPTGDIQPGSWNASADFGGFDFLVNSSSTHIRAFSRILRL
jgi:hypothetical protein